MSLKSLILFDKQHCSHTVKLNGFYYKPLKTQVLYNQSIRLWIRSRIQATTWWYHHHHQWTANITWSHGFYSYNNCALKTHNYSSQRKFYITKSWVKSTTKANANHHHGDFKIQKYLWLWFHYPRKLNTVNLVSFKWSW